MTLVKRTAWNKGLKTGKGSSTSFKSGMVPWNKGIPMSEESKRRLSEAKMGQVSWNKGKKFSTETREKQRQRKLESPTRFWLGRKRPALSGDKHPNWKGGYENKLHDNRKRRIARKAAPGTHSLAEWLNLKQSFSFTCPACKRAEPEIQLTEDHIQPLSKGGADSIDNIQPLCVSCNSKKKAKTIRYLPVAA